MPDDNSFQVDHPENTNITNGYNGNGNQQIHQSETQPFVNGGEKAVMMKVLEANKMEQSGDVDAAIEIYQNIINTPGEGFYKEVARQGLQNLGGDPKLTSPKTNRTNTATHTTVKESFTHTTVKKSFFQRINLKWKATFLAIGIGTLPVLLTGTIAYSLAESYLTKEVLQAEETLASNFANQVAEMMEHNLEDVQGLGTNSILTNAVSEQNNFQILRVLNNYLSRHNLASNAAILDLNGNVIVQAGKKSLPSQKNMEYFQKVIKTGKPAIGQPKVFETKELIDEKGKKEALQNFVVPIAAPIKDSRSEKVIAVVQSSFSMDSLEEKIKYIARDGNEYFLIDRQRRFFLHQEKRHQGKFVKDDYPALNELISANKATAVDIQDPNEDSPEILAYTPLPKLEELPDLGWSAGIAIESSIAYEPLKKLFWTLTLGSLTTALVVGAIATIIAERAIRPIVAATDAVEKIGQGDLDARVFIKGNNELSRLVNSMAETIQSLLEQQKAETKRQREGKENLQQEVFQLLSDIEKAQKGDLTVKGKVSPGTVGSIADAFNNTIGKLRQLLLQVQNVSNQVSAQSQKGENSVRQFSNAAVIQAEEIEQTLEIVEQMNQSIQNVARSSSEAAGMARSAWQTSQLGDRTMDSTVQSIEQIRKTVAETTKKMKQLAESSQEISQIVEIISSISEKTNLLAFNASVEASRAGEHGQGFRIVADEVRRLADRVQDSTKEIQQLVNTIQEDTTITLESMENSTAEVVNGTQLVQKTKQILQNLAVSSEKIDQYLQVISASNHEQEAAATQVNVTIAKVADIANNTSTEAQEVVESLQILVEESNTLQASVAEFKLQSS